MRFRWASCLLLVLSACLPSGGQDLEIAVHRYNDGLRWKRFAEAASYLPPELRADFLADHLAKEDALHIDQIEVQAVSMVPDTEVPTFDVVLLAEAYVLPRTVLDRVVVKQRWQQSGPSWQLVSASGAPWAEVKAAN
jgi:hypothetical protein